MRACIVGSAMLLMLAPVAASAEVTGNMRLGINFPGHDITAFIVGDNDPETCQAACTTTEGCVAWTFVKPGIQDAASACWLKDAVAPAETSECCISGTMEITEVSPQGGYFARPRIGAYDVDICYFAGQECGRPAADAFCASLGFGGASEWRQAASEATYSIGSQIICEAPAACVALREVTCFAR